MKHHINLIVRRMTNHAGASGYDRLAESINARVITPIKAYQLHHRIAGRLFRPLATRSQSYWYHREALLQELTAAVSWFKGSGQIFHFLYGENCFRYLGCLKSVSSQNKIVATYHTPREKFNFVVQNRSHLRKLDAAIVVSTVQHAFMADLVGAGKVHYIPHGIDTAYFSPAGEAKDPSQRIQCLFVGMHLRDFETMARAAKILNQQSCRFHLTVVTFRRNHHYFDAIDNVTCLHRISDASLLNLYRNSHALLLPMLESTANNTILEAMACGLPIVTTNLFGVRDYVDDTCAILTPLHDPGALADSVSQMQYSPETLNAMAGAARRRSEDFSWPNVAQQTMTLYSKLGVGNKSC
jgi:glycosyltransferase involved in cell wall biosynthesis